MSPFRIFIVISICAGLGWLLYWSNSTPTTSATTTVAPIDPRDLEFVQLLDCRDKPDPMRTLELLDTSGNRWFCDPIPCVDREAVDPERCHVDVDENNKSVILIGVKPRHQKRLLHWTQNRVGEKVGVCLNGSIRLVAVLHAPLGSMFQIPNVGSNAEAEALAADLRARAKRFAR